MNFSDILGSDILLIEHLTDNGLTFLDKCLTVLGKDIRIINALKLYLFEELFEDSVNRLFTYIIEHPDTKIYNLLSTSLTDDETKVILSYAPSFVKDLRFDQLLILMTHIIPTTGSDYNFIQLLLVKLILTSDDTYLDSCKKIAKIIVKTDVHKFIEWVEDLCNKNRIKMNLEPSINTDLISDTCLANLLSTLLIMWNFYEDHIDSQYPISDKTNMKWYDKKVVIPTVNIKTKLFFVIQNLIRISFAPLFHRIKTWKLHIQTFEETNHPTLMTRILGLDHRKHVVDEDENIVNNFPYENLFNFYDYFFDELLWRKVDLCIDDQLQNYFEIVLNRSIPEMYDQIKKVSIHILTNKNVTKNSEVIMGTINVTYSLTQVENDIYTQAEKDQIIKAFIKFVINIYEQKISLSYKLEYVTKLLSYILKLNKKNTEYQTALNNYVSNNCYKTTKFLNIYINIINELVTECKTIISEMDDDDNELYEVEAYFEDAQLIDKMLTDLINKFKSLFEIQEILNLYKNTSILEITASMIYNTLDFYCGEMFNRLHNSKPIKILYFVIHKIASTNNKIFIKITESINYNSKLLNKIVEMLDDKHITQVMENLNNAKNEEEILTNIPDRFIDPITSWLIEDPVILPYIVSTSDIQFLDRSTIEQHLLFSQENPFTRNKLTLKELNKFNDLPEIKQKCDDFKNEFIKWKSEQKDK